MEKLTFFREFEGAVTPNRGSDGAAGIDFYVPKPLSLADKCFDFEAAKIASVLSNREQKEAALSRCASFMISDDIEKAFWRTTIEYNKALFNNKCDSVELVCNKGEWFLMLNPGDSITIPTGISVMMPHGYCILFVNKSGIASKNNILIGAQLIDEDYTGVMHINIHNVGKNVEFIRCGQKLTQGILMESNIAKVSLDIVDGRNDGKTDRGEGGFGSTGK